MVSGVVKSVNDFVISLIEALVIVVGVLLVFMGVRSGLIIGIVLLLTVVATLIVMNPQGIFFQQVSLAAMIIMLGSLVGNAIVVTKEDYLLTAQANFARVCFRLWEYL